MNSQTPFPPRLFTVEHFPDLFVDAVLRDAAGELLFASIYGRDAIVLQLMASFTLPTSQGGHNSLTIVDAQSRQKHLVMVSHADRLDKLSGKMQTRSFGELIHMWLFDPMAVQSDRANKRALLLRFSETEESFRFRCWQSIQTLSSVALLDHWQAPLIEALGDKLIRPLTGSDMPPIGVIDAARIELGDHFETMISIAVANGALTLDAQDRPANYVDRILAAYSRAADVMPDLQSSEAEAPVTVKPKLFALGQIAVTPGVHELVIGGYIMPSELLRRHQTGDWGEVCAEDAKQNDLSVKEGMRILSVYPIDAAEPCKGRNRIYVLTEADRSVTTVLLPSEY